MRFKAVRAIFRKEIRELCRDKRTMFVMFALPLIVYPLLIIGISSVMIGMESSYETESYILALENAGESLAGQLFDASASGESDYRFEPAADGTEADTAAALAEGTIDVLLRVNGTEYIIEYNSASVRSEKAADHLRSRLEQYARALSAEQLTAAGLDAEACLSPIRIISEDKATDETAFGSILGGIVPMLLIMGVFFGAMMSAMDVTAGEKERGTQETLMTFPISGRELICGKFLAVALSGVLSAILYMVTVGLIGAYMIGMIGAAGTEFSIDLRAFLPSLAVLFAAVIAFSLLLSAAMMCVCTFAKSEKEASSYLSPVMVVVMLVSYLGFLDVHLTPTFAIIPVLNIVLLIKSVLVFEYDAAAILLVLVSNLAYAAVAVTVLGKLYTSERVLFGEREGSLLERRSTRIPGSVPTPGDSVLVLLIVMVLFLYLGSLLQVKFLLIGVGLTQLIVAAIPIFAAWYGRVDMRVTFRLRLPKLKTFLSLLILAPGAFLLCNMLVQPLAGLAADSAETYSEAFALLEDGQSFALTLLVVGILPALCEETLFRGYLYASLQKTLGPWAAIAVSALLFGVYHLNLYQGCYAFLLGLILAFTAEYSGSILSSCLIHFICNSIAVLMTYFPDALSAVPLLSSDSPAASAILLAVGAALTALGMFLFLRSRKAEAPKT